MLMVPLVGILAGTSDSIIEIVLGKHWLPASPIFLWLSVIAVAQTSLSGSGWLFITQGRAKEMMQWGIIGSTLTVTSFVLGLRWGAIGVAASYSISGLFIQTPVFLWMVCRRGPVSIRVYYRVIVRYVEPTMLIFLLILFFRILWGDMNPFCGLLLSLGLYLLVALVMVTTNSHTRSHFRELLRRVFKREKNLSI